MIDVLGIVFDDGKEVKKLVKYLHLPGPLVKRLDDFDFEVVIYTIKSPNDKLSFWGWDMYKVAIADKDYNQNTVFVLFKDIEKALESLVKGY